MSERLGRLEALQRRRDLVAARTQRWEAIARPTHSVTVLSTPASDGLRASTVTPGSTPPELSRTVPSIQARCSWAIAGAVSVSAVKMLRITADKWPHHEGPPHRLCEPMIGAIAEASDTCVANRKY